MNQHTFKHKNYPATMTITSTSATNALIVLGILVDDIADWNRITKQ